MRTRSLAAALILGLSLSGAASAGVFTDDLTRCLVNKTSDADRVTLVRWLFAAMAMHPDVKSLAEVSDAKRAEVTKAAAELFERLLTDSCRAEFRAAVKNEGQSAIATSFQAFGNVAGSSLMQNPDVGKAAAELNAVLDQQKIEAVLKEGN